METLAGHFEAVDRDQECRRRVSEIIQSAGQLILGFRRLRQPPIGNREAMP